MNKPIKISFPHSYYFKHYNTYSGMVLINSLWDVTLHGILCTDPILYIYIYIHVYLIAPHSKVNCQPHIEVYWAWMGDYCNYVRLLGPAVTVCQV